MNIKLYTMKKLILLLNILCIAFGASSQLLWKVTGNDLSKPSYIFGSHHMAPLSIKDSIAGFNTVLKETEQMYGEINMDEMMHPDVIAEMQQKMMMQGDTSLTTLFTPTQYDSINVVLKQYLGADLAIFNKVKPAAISAQLAVVLATQAIKGYNPMEQLDTWFQTNAKIEGKYVGSLETIEQQLYILYESQSLKRQAELLFGTIKDMDKMVKLTKDMYDYYMKQDLDGLNKVMEEEMDSEAASTPEEEDALIYNRNKNWTEKLPGIMKDKSTLVVVGSAHLPGEEGLLNLLKQKGYNLEPVK